VSATASRERRARREEHLHQELSELERALEAFGDPDTAARPGLQLMGDALRTKYADVRDKFRRSDTLALEVEVEGEPVDGELIDATLVARLVDELVPLSRRLGAAVADGDGPRPTDAQLDAALALRFAGGLDEAPGLRLVGPAREARRLAPGPDREPSLLETALHRLLDLADDPGSPELAPLRQVLGDVAARATLRLYPPFDEPRSAEVDGIPPR
jgi:hypothetical protein